MPIIFRHRTRCADTSPRFLPLLAFLLCWLPWAATAQIDWLPLGGPQGPGIVKDLAIAPSGEYFMLNDRGVFRSQDGGASWARLPYFDPMYPGVWSNLDVLPDGTLIASRGTEIYRMPPGGNQLMAVYKHPSFLEQIQHTPSGMLIAWDGSSRSLFKSEDQGSGWELLYGTSYHGGRLFVNGNGKNYFGSGESYIQFEEDGNQQRQLSCGFGSRGFCYLPDKDAIATTINSTLATTLDGGINWNNFPLPSPQAGLGSMVYDLANSRLLLGLGDTIWATSNLGADWQVWFALPKNSGNYFDMVSENSGKMLLKTSACDPGILLRSDNSGQTWTETGHLFQEDPTSEIIRDHAGNLYARTCYSVWKRSIDDGKSWQRLRSQPGMPHIDQLLLTREGILFGQDFDGRVFRSIDHGKNWVSTGALTPTSRLYEGGDGAIYCIHQSNPNEAFVSDNLGKSWTSLGLMNPLLFAAHPDGSLYRMNNPSAPIQRSVDHGFTWLDLPVNPPTNVDYSARLYCSPTGAMYIFGPQQFSLIVSTDGFASWAALSAPRFDALTFDASGRLYGIASLANELYRLDPSTSNWEQLYTLLDRSLLTCAINRDQYLYIAGDHGGIYRSAAPVGSGGALRGQVQILADCTAPDAAAQPGQLVKAQNASGTFIAATSLIDSTFRFFIPQGNYQLSLATASPFYPACSPVQTVAVPSADTVQLKIGPSGVSCPALRVSSANPFLRRCFDNDYTISWCNEGNASTANAWLEVTLDPFFEFVGATFPIDLLGTNTVHFDLGTLAPMQCGSLKLRVKVSCDAVLGQVHCLTSRILPDTLCLPGLNTGATYQECGENRGSFDPNDKTAYVNGREEAQQYPANAALEYLVRFQNTGTDTAFRVVVEDRLSQRLDAATFRPLVASHAYRWEIRPDPSTGEHVLRFIFDPILLPDSSTNEAASHGFVKFAVQPKQPAQSGAVLENFADIFFDYNPPVRTNTVRLSYTSGVRAAPVVPSAKISPQPFHDFARVEMDYAGECRFQLFDSQGRILCDDRATGGQYTLQRGQLPSGVYFCRFVSEDGGVVAVGKLVAD